MPDPVRHDGDLGVEDYCMSRVPSCCHAGLEPVSRASAL